MRIGIFNQHFGIGGVETFLLSLVRQFRFLNIDVDVFLIDDGQSNSLIGELSPLNVRIFNVDLFYKQKVLTTYDVLLVTNPDTLIEASRLFHIERIYANKLIVAVFQTRMFCLNRGKFNLHNKITRKLFSTNVPIENVLFGNDACRIEHAVSNPSMLNAIVIPLIVDEHRFKRRPTLKRTETIRIVSVGRLDYFKTYNITMMKVVSKLRKLGHNVVWDIYGDGYLLPEMRIQAERLELLPYVKFHGSISYSILSTVYEDAFVFVGSGLSMMEAAASGVPSIPAIEYSKDAKAFGFVHEIPGISFFEPSLAFPQKDICDLVLSLLERKGNEYDEICELSRLKMSEFFSENISQQYLNMFAKASSKKPRMPLWNYFIFKISRYVHQKGASILRSLKLRKI